MADHELLEILSTKLLDDNRNLVVELKQIDNLVHQELRWHYQLDLTWIINNLDLDEFTDVLNPNQASPPEATLFALQILLATVSGRPDTRTDWDQWLADARFLPPKKIELPSRIGSSLTIARKPIA